MSRFGDYLRELRKRQGFSLDDLAAETRISRTYLWKLEKNPDVNPSIKLLQRLAGPLDTTVGYLAQEVGGLGDGKDLWKRDQNTSIQAKAEANYHKRCDNCGEDISGSGFSLCLECLNIATLDHLASTETLC